MRVVLLLASLLAAAGCGSTGGDSTAPATTATEPSPVKECLLNVSMAYVVFDRAETDDEAVAARDALVSALLSCVDAAGAAGLDLNSVQPQPAAIILVGELLPGEPADRVDLYARVLTMALRG